MLSSTKKKKKTVFWLQGIIAITLSLFMYLFLCFLVYISWKSGSRPKFYVIFQRGHWQSQSFAWQALEEGKVAVLPMQTWCTVRAFPSRTGASCRQGLRLRNLYSEVCFHVGSLCWGTSQEIFPTPPHQRSWLNYFSSLRLRLSSCLPLPSLWS